MKEASSFVEALKLVEAHEKSRTPLELTIQNANDWPNMRIFFEALGKNKTLRSLVIKAPIKNDGISALSISLQTNTALERLELYQCQIDLSGYCALAMVLNSNKSLKALLIEGQNLLNGLTIPVLAKAAQNSALEILSLKSTNQNPQNLSESESQALANLISKTASLRALSLNSLRMDLHGVKVIAGALRDNKTIRTFTLYDGNIAASVSCFTEVLSQNTTVVELNLENNRINALHIGTFTQALATNGSLRILSLTGNDIGTEGAAQFEGVLSQNKSLETLLLGNNNIGLDTKRLDLYGYSNQDGEQQAAKAFGALQRGLTNNKSLKVLSLLGNPVGFAGIMSIAQVLITSTIEELSLCNIVGFKKEHVDLLSVALSNPDARKKLKKLYLAGNPIGDSIMPLAGALYEHPTLEFLSLNKCGIRSTNEYYVVQLIERNCTLKEISLNENSISAAGAINILQALRKNTRIISLPLDKQPAPLDSSILKSIEQELAVNKEIAILTSESATAEEKQGAFSILVAGDLSSEKQIILMQYCILQLKDTHILSDQKTHYLKIIADRIQNGANLDQDFLAALKACIKTSFDENSKDLQSSIFINSAFALINILSRRELWQEADARVNLTCFQKGKVFASNLSDNVAVAEFLGYWLLQSERLKEEVLATNSPYGTEIRDYASVLNAFQKGVTEFAAKQTAPWSDSENPYQLLPRLMSEFLEEESRDRISSILSQAEGDWFQDAACREAVYQALLPFAEGFFDKDNRLLRVDAMKLNSEDNKWIVYWLMKAILDLNQPVEACFNEIVRVFGDEQEVLKISALLNQPEATKLFANEFFRKTLYVLLLKHSQGFLDAKNKLIEFDKQTLSQDTNERWVAYLLLSHLQAYGYSPPSVIKPKTKVLENTTTPLEGDANNNNDSPTDVVAETNESDSQRSASATPSISGDTSDSSFDDLVNDKPSISPNAVPKPQKSAGVYWGAAFLSLLLYPLGMILVGTWVAVHRYRMQGKRNGTVGVQNSEFTLPHQLPKGAATNRSYFSIWKKTYQDGVDGVMNLGTSCHRSRSAMRSR